MRRWIFVATASCSLLALGLTAELAARADGLQTQVRPGRQEIKPENGAVGSLQAPSRMPHAGQHGATIIADAHGLLVAERNAGVVVRSDREGNPKGSLKLHEGLGELVHDGNGQVFVADRAADRVLRIEPGDAQGKGLVVADEIEVVEPHGLALTPDGETLLVTSVANHELVAVDTRRKQVRWRVELAPEPRGVAVSRDGRRAIVGFLSSGALAVIDLAAEGQEIRWRALDPRDRIEIEEDEEGFGGDAALREARTRFQVPTGTGRRRARNVFAVGFVGDDLAVAPHQLATPQMKMRPVEERGDSYGGGSVSIPPLVYRMAMLADAGATPAKVGFTSLAVHQPRALAYDFARDTLYVGGYGDDRLVAIAEVSQRSPYVEWVAELDDGESHCGIDGLAVDGEAVVVHCELARRVVRLDAEAVTVAGDEVRLSDGAIAVGPELAPSLRSELVERGAELFRRGGDSRLSDSGVMACASCHPEGRADGLTWRLGKSILQTPILAGRVVGTAPYKWDGQDVSLSASLRHTVNRLGGFSGSVRSREFKALQAYVESLPAPRTRTAEDPAAVARGKQLFASKSLACDACHAGDKLADGAQYDLGLGLGDTDTPSLVGLGQSAPYYHDGSARDLYTLMTDRGNVHEMADLSGLSDVQVHDLVAYLRTL